MGGNTSEEGMTSFEVGTCIRPHPDHTHYLLNREMVTKTQRDWFYRRREKENEYLQSLPLNLDQIYLLKQFHLLLLSLKRQRKKSNQNLIFIYPGGIG